MISTGNNTINGVTYKGGSAGQIDQNLFAYGFDALQNGNNVATVVSYRPDGNYSIQRFTASQVPDLGHSTTNGLGLGDLNEDGHINTTDVLDFFEAVASNGQQFNPSADMYGNGLNDVNSWLAFDQELQQNNLLSTSSPYYVSSSTISYFNTVSPSVNLALPAGTTYGLMVPVSTATLGNLSLGAGSTLSVTGTGSTNTPYSVTFGSTSLGGSVNINASNNGTGAGVLNLGGLSDGGVGIALQFGGNGTVSLNASSSLSAATTVAISAGATLQVKANNALGTNGVAITNNGALVVDGNQTIGNLSGPGTLTVGNGSTENTLQLAANSGGSTVSSLTINGFAALDITNNYLIINYGTGADPIAGIRQYLVNGYDGGQ